VGFAQFPTVYALENTAPPIGWILQNDTAPSVGRREGFRPTPRSIPAQRIVVNPQPYPQIKPYKADNCFRADKLEYFRREKHEAKEPSRHDPETHI